MCAAEDASQQTFSNRVSELVLSSCRIRDAGAQISSILRDSQGRTVVRVRTGDGDNPLTLLKALKELWPLASTAVIENALDGSVEAQIVVPRESDERSFARKRASALRLAECLWMLCVVLFLVGCTFYAMDVYEARRNSSAAPGADTDREL